MKKIVIIGAGSMASAFCFPCVDNGNTTYLVGTHLEMISFQNSRK
jgi:glycerol-3-phosphate dehydrogenase